MNRDTLYFIIVFAIFLLLPDNTKYPVTDFSERALSGYKEILRTARTTLLNGQYGQGYGNLTGFKLSYEDNLQDRNALLWPFHDYSPTTPWQETQQDSLLPNEISDKVKLFWGQSKVLPGKKAYLLNISGDVYGEFDITKSISQLKPYKSQIPTFLEDYYESLRNQKYEEEKQRYEDDPENNQPPQEFSNIPDKVGNITNYSEGEIVLRIRSLASSISDTKVQNRELAVYKDAVLVSVQIELRNFIRSDVNEFEMFAVYFQDTGSIVGLTKSAKFLGLHALPHFTLNSDNYEKSKILVGRLLNLTSVDDDVTIEDVGRSVEQAQTRCELVSFIQLKKSSLEKAQLRFIDDELQDPQGLPIPNNIPQIEVGESLFYSPDCGILFEKKSKAEFTGVRQEVRYFQLRRALFFMFILSIIELRLFMKQTKISRTPSSLSNISTYCIGLLSGYDLIIAMIMTLIMWLTELYLICACLAIFNILLFYVFQLRYLLSISATQANERGSSWREILRGSTIRHDDGDRDLEAQAEPAPAAAAPATPEETQEPFFTRDAVGRVQFLLLTFFVSFAVTVTLYSVSSNLVTLRFFEYSCLLAFNSYLLPQFFRNTLKNRSQSLLWEFSIGTALVRLIPLYYLCLNEANPFKHPFDPILVTIITCWLLVQLFLLYCQSVWGARFWVNSKWLPEQYNYQPTLTLKDLEDGFSSDILSSLKPEMRDGDFLLCETDCAICMSSLTIPILMSDTPKDKVSNHLMKRILVTPCYHVFHLDCLEGWMVQKLQCPVCRTALPPV